MGHTYGVEDDILDSDDAYRFAEPCYAVPPRPGFTGPGWALSSLCGNIVLDIGLTPVGTHVFTFQPDTSMGSAPYRITAEAEEDQSPDGGMFRVDPSSGEITVALDLSRYCGCVPESFVDMHATLADSAGRGASQSGALSIELRGCEEPVCPSATPTPSRSLAATPTRSRAVTPTGSPASTPSVTRSRSATPSRSRLRA